MSTPSIVVVSSSLNQQSRSRIMARYAGQSLAAHAIDVQLLDLAQIDVGVYPASAQAPGLLEATEQFNAAHGWVLAAPIYNFGASAVLLNFLHYALDSAFGRWKPFVLLSSMGGQRSALALDHIARTLVYEVSAVQVGPTISNIGDTDVNRTTGEMSLELRQRMDTHLTVLSRYVQTRAEFPR
ncbi:NAD(P)H-dependent oxidoreductase [soil metagenome]